MPRGRRWTPRLRPSRRDGSRPLPEVLKLVPVWSNALDGSDVRAQRQVLGHLVARVAATRVRRGVYDVNVTWTPLGRALREIPLRARRLRTLDQG